MSNKDEYQFEHYSGVSDKYRVKIYGEFYDIRDMGIFQDHIIEVFLKFYYRMQPGKTYDLTEYGFNEWIDIEITHFYFNRFMKTKQGNKQFYVNSTTKNGLINIAIWKFGPMFQFEGRSRIKISKAPFFDLFNESDVFLFQYLEISRNLGTLRPPIPSAVSKKKLQEVNKKTGFFTIYDDTFETSEKGSQQLFILNGIIKNLRTFRISLTEAHHILKEKDKKKLEQLLYEEEPQSQPDHLVAAVKKNGELSPKDKTALQRMLDTGKLY